MSLLSSSCNSSLSSSSECATNSSLAGAGVSDSGTASSVAAPDFALARVAPSSDSERRCARVRRDDGVAVVAFARLRVGVGVGSGWFAACKRALARVQRGESETVGQPGDDMTGRARGAVRLLTLVCVSGSSSGSEDDPGGLDCLGTSGGTLAS